LTRHRMPQNDVQARVVGKVQIWKLTIAKHLQSIDAELAARDINFNGTHNWTKRSLSGC
jgi:hypothetical protein